jgi:hypothetical protein
MGEAFKGSGFINTLLLGRIVIFVIIGIANNRLYYEYSST